MPHCIIEYSTTLQAVVVPEKLLEAVHNGAVNSGLFETSHIKTRAIAYEHFIPGYQVDDFIHVTLRILSGRDQHQKKHLSSAVLSELKSLGLSSLSITVEITDIDRDTYSKTVD